MQSGIAGDIAEKDDILSAMHEAVEEAGLMNKRDREAINSREQRKMEAGRQIVAEATARPDINRRQTVGTRGNEVISVPSLGYEGSERKTIERSGVVTPATEEEVDRVEIADGGGESTLGGDRRQFHRRRRKSFNNGARFDVEVDRFGEILREADGAKVAIERERLGIYGEKFETDKNERLLDLEKRKSKEEKGHMERKEEHDSRDKLELDKFSLMMETFSNASK